MARDPPLLVHSHQVCCRKGKRQPRGLRAKGSTALTRQEDRRQDMGSVPTKQGTDTTAACAAVVSVWYGPIPIAPLPRHSPCHPHYPYCPC